MTKLTFIADTHHYSKTLGTTGRQYNLRSGSDQKCLAETDEIIDAAFKKIAASDTDAVMIAGDVTNDGEMVSHLEFRQKLYELKKSKPVYIITATHDWCCDENPRRFYGGRVTHDVEVMKSNDLPEFYKDFGPDDAISKFTTHIGTCSYVVQLADNVRLLALNDDKNSDNHAGFTDAHFAWIEQQINKAYEDNCLIIGMEHHLLMPHISPLITGGGTCVANRKYVASRLADTGLRYMFVGHSHIQNTTDFTSEKGNTLTEVNVGSLVGYPAPIVHVTVNEDMTLSYEVEHLEEFMLDGKAVDAQKFLKNHALALIHRLLDSPNKQELADRLSALQMNGGKIAHYSALILPIFKFVKTARTIDLYKKLKYLGFAKMLDKSLFEKFKDKKILDFVDEIMLSAFDGSITKYSRDDDYYILIMSVLSVLEKILNNNENIEKAVSAVDTILTGGKFDNQCAAI